MDQFDPSSTPLRPRFGPTTTPVRKRIGSYRPRNPYGFDLACAPDWRAGAGTRRAPRQAFRRNAMVCCFLTDTALDTLPDTVTSLPDTISDTEPDTTSDTVGACGSARTIGQHPPASRIVVRERGQIRGQTRGQERGQVRGQTRGQSENSRPLHPFGMPAAVLAQQPRSRLMPGLMPLYAMAWFQMPDQMPPTGPVPVPPGPDLPEPIEEPPTGIPTPPDVPPPTWQ